MADNNSRDDDEDPERKSIFTKQAFSEGTKQVFSVGTKQGLFNRVVGSNSIFSNR